MNLQLNNTRHLLVSIGIILFSISGIQCGLLIAPQNQVVLVNSTFTLTCATDVSNSAVKWYIDIAGGGGIGNIYEGGTLKEPYDEIFSVETSRVGTAWNYNLRTKAGVNFSQINLAGRYTCTDRDGTGAANSSEVIIVQGNEANCTNNNTAALCPGDIMRISCTYPYHGNSPPELQFGLSNGANFSATNVRNIPNTEIIYELDLRITNTSDEQTVWYSSDYKQLTSPNTPIFGVTNKVISGTKVELERSLRCGANTTITTDAASITCEANSNSPNNKTYTWVRVTSDSSTTLNSTGAILVLNANDIAAGDKFVCTARLQLKCTNEQSTCSQSFTVVNETGCSVPPPDVFQWAQATEVITISTAVCLIFYAIYWLVFYDKIDGKPLYLGLLLILIPSIMILIGSAVILSRLMKSARNFCLKVNPRDWCIGLIVMHSVTLLLSAVLIALVPVAKNKPSLLNLLAKLTFAACIFYILIDIASIAWTFVLMRDYRDHVTGYGGKFSWEIFLIVFFGTAALCAALLIGYWLLKRKNIKVFQR